MSHSTLRAPSWFSLIVLGALCLLIAGCNPEVELTETLTKRSTSQGTVHIYEKIETVTPYHPGGAATTPTTTTTYNILMPDGEQFVVSGSVPYDVHTASPDATRMADALIDAWVKSKEDGTWFDMVGSLPPGSKEANARGVVPSQRKPPAEFLNLASVAPDQIGNFQSTSGNGQGTTTDVANDVASDTASAIAGEVTQSIMEDAATEAASGKTTTCTGIGIDAC